jgi:hypothetical protein
MSHLHHYHLPINSITIIILSISQYRHLLSPPTRSVTIHFNYQFYAVHLTLYTTLCHPSHTISYQSITLPILCCSSHNIDILISPPHDQLPFNSITFIMLSISHYKRHYVTPPTRSVTNQFHDQYYALHLTI